MRDEIYRLKSHIAAVLQHMDSPDDVNQLLQENERLRIENSNLRELLRLARYSYEEEITQSRQESHSLLHVPSESSILLTTPPRSPPPLGHNRPLSRRSTTQISDCGHMTNPDSSNPDNAQATSSLGSSDVLDIADVGPPLSPPPSVRPCSPTITEDPCSAIDIQEATEASQEVDHDLAS